MSKMANVNLLQTLEKCDTIERIGSSDFALPLSRDEWERLERQLIGMLQSVRRVQNKRPVIIPGEKRAHD